MASVRQNENEISEHYVSSSALLAIGNGWQHEVRQRSFLRGAASKAARHSSIRE